MTSNGINRNEAPSINSPEFDQYFNQCGWAQDDLDEINGQAYYGTSPDIIGFHVNELKKAVYRQFLTEVA